MAKVLIVDDDKINRQMLERILNKASYIIETADSGKSAMELMEKDPPDIILLDVVMPELDGFQVCRRIRKVENFKMIPIIFITALEETEDKVKGFEAGANDYITRPFRQVEVLARVKAHLRIREMEEELFKKERQLAISALIATLNHKINNALFSLPLWKEFVERKKAAGAPEKDLKTLRSMIDKIDYVVRLVRKISELTDKANLDKIKYEEYVAGDVMLDTEDL